MMLNEINAALDHVLDYLEDSRVKEAMNYSLQAGGKRFRPMLVLTACKDGCGKYKEAMPLAMALEMVHTYSLIHDDLPAMDDDDLRRGRLTCHKKYDEATAILAGDGLLTEAFSVIASSSLNDHQKAECVKILANCAGSNGMVLGQILDMAAEQTPLNSLDDLKRVHINKTGQLFACALKMGAIAAGKEDTIDMMDQIGKMMGIAFQIQDDILDVTETMETLGKSNSDEKNNKTTYVSLMGLASAKMLMNEAYSETIALLEALPFEAKGIMEIIKGMQIRKM